MTALYCSLFSRTEETLFRAHRTLSLVEPERCVQQHHSRNTHQPPRFETRTQSRKIILCSHHATTLMCMLHIGAMGQEGSSPGLLPPPCVPSAAASLSRALPCACLGTPRSPSAPRMPVVPLRVDVPPDQRKEQWRNAIVITIT